jgi:uncharacterized protein YjbK
MTGHLEREFKLWIPDERAFAALLERLGGPRAAPCRQVNHDSDTPKRALRAARIALRLLAVSGRWTLGLKGPPISRGHRDHPGRSCGPDVPDATLAARPEEELQIAPEEARAILAGECSPLDELAASPAGASALVRTARTRTGAEPLLHLGSFENQRTRVGPLALPDAASGARIVFELDRIRFPGGRVERELEVEVADDAEARAVWGALERLFSAVGLPLESVPSKAARFFRILDSCE